MEKKREILIVFATDFEAEQLYKSIDNKDNFIIEGNNINSKSLNIEVLICGIGIPATTYSLTKAVLKKKYDLVINAGICGSYNDDFYIGDSVSVILDEFADIGITYEDNSFKTLFEEKLLEQNAKPYNNGKLYNSIKQNIDTELPKVTAITVNTTSGNKEQIEFRRDKFNPDIESMEGAVTAYVCLKEKLDFLQIRTVSNKVEVRNKDNWDINTALENLSQELINILQKIDALIH